MKKKNFNSQSGMSLIEIVVVLVIVGILATMAIVRFDSSRVNLTRQNVVKELKTYLERARFDSVKRRAGTSDNDKSRVVIRNATSFDVITDLNQNGTIEGGEVRTINFSGSQSKFVGNLVYPITITFDRHGHVEAKNNLNQEIDPFFTICDKGCSNLETANTGNSSGISISPSGTVAILAGGETQPTFNSPTVSNANSNEVSNPWLRTDNGYDGETETNTNTNANTNTNTGNTNTGNTNTGNTNTNPVPTSTPRTCNINERPATANCRCLLPMTVRANGQCKN